MPKFSRTQRSQIESIVANLSIKRIPEAEIIQEITRQTGKSISRVMLFYIRQRIKKESAKWYSQLREGQYEYLHEFRERMMEIMDLQKKAHKIINNNENNPGIQLAAISELHKLNITLSNYFDVAPFIGNASISETPATTKRNINKDNIIV